MTELDRVAAHEAFRRSVEAAGSQSAFERATGALQQKVSYWLRKGMLLPAEYVLAAEAATGVSRHDLRPDIYPHDMPAAAAPVVGQGRGPVVCDRKPISQLGEPAR